ncbi:MAG: homoserine O-acetyltransferase [Cyclobacteriaceae bacterium]|nr:homoserine O-acetyltransferase [Cyclobacteriaceae bacterium]
MIEGLKHFNYQGSFELESGKVIENPRIGYHTFGTLNEKKDNVVWVCHALTANSNVPEWWGKVAGPEGYFNPEKHFIVCANILGSLYGTTNPNDTDPATGEPFYKDFPFFTLRDITRLHLLLKDHLNIDNIYFAIGGSCGGQQVLELAVMLGDSLKNIMAIVASAKETAWSIAIHTTQRMAIEADGTWGDKNEKAAAKGLKAARGIGLLGYRTFDSYVERQTDNDDRTDGFKAESYIRYQGDKLEKRFNAYAYWHLTKALDSHNLGRGRGSVEKALSSIRAKSLIIGIDTDTLIPPSEQKFITAHIPESHYACISSNYGHDGFLIEQDKIVKEIDNFINSHHGI